MNNYELKIRFEDEEGLRDYLRQKATWNEVKEFSMWLHWQWDEGDFSEETRIFVQEVWDKFRPVLTAADYGDEFSGT